MNRIITVGCSYTFGHGLADCIELVGNGPGPDPSNLGFATMLADYLGRPLVNLAQPGASDKQIMNIADNTTFNESDICLLQWSHNDRHCVIEGQYTNKLGPWMDTKIAKLYYKRIHNDNDAVVMRSVYINYINLKLRNLGVKTYNILPITATCINIDKLIIMSNKNIQHFRVDTALDNSHPGPKSQKLFAEYLINEYF